ncbi:hypothetical protein [Subtercola boreus]|uniref:hypothetical protein n=1 Tax=Subtercola boreus TaxID=120213 RepID=UPI0011C06792|nr:hypothetical protein [Subtercola boreus]
MRALQVVDQAVAGGGRNHGRLDVGALSTVTGALCLLASGLVEGQLGRRQKARADAAPALASASAGSSASADEDR